MNSKHLWDLKKQDLDLDSGKPLYSRNSGMVMGDHSAETFKPLWQIVATWQSYVTDGYKVYPSFIEQGDQIISKTYMTRVENENTACVIT